MKKLLLLSSVLCMVSTVSFGMEVKPYIEGRFSENYMKSDFKSNVPIIENKKLTDDAVQGGSVEVGVKVDAFRLGLEGYYNDKMKDSMNVNLTSDVSLPIPVKMKSKGLFLNGYYDIPMPESLKKVKPYLGAGIGYSWLDETIKSSIIGMPELSDLVYKDKDLGWNVGLGVGYELNPNVDLTLGYRYENLGEINKTKYILGGEINSKNELTNNKLSVGLRYTF